MHAWTSTWVSLVSMLLYTVSNATLRHLGDLDVPIDWCLAVKEAIAVAVLAPWVIFRLVHRRYRFQSKRLLLILVIASLICEVIGAQNQLVAYALVGLVIAVPALQSCQLIATALIGNYYLNDKISRSKWIAMGLLLGAVFLLSFGKSLNQPSRAETHSLQENVTQIQQTPESQGFSRLTLRGVGAALIAGLAYSVYINAIRYTLRRDRGQTLDPWDSINVRDWIGHDFATHRREPLPLSEASGQMAKKQLYSPFPITLIMIFVTGIGMLYYGTSVVVTRGFAGFGDVPSNCWFWIILSGITNVIGFFFQIQGLLLASAAKVSLISAFQIVIFAFLGILFFNESMNICIAIGVMLAIIGVLFSSQDAE